MKTLKFDFFLGKLVRDSLLRTINFMLHYLFFMMTQRWFEHSSKEFYVRNFVRLIHERALKAANDLHTLEGELIGLLQETKGSRDREKN